MSSINRVLLLFALLLGWLIVTPQPAQAQITLDNASQQAKLVPGDLTAYDGFGSAVALEGDTAVIGAPKISGNPSGLQSPGAAYVYLFSNGSWSQQAKLTADDGVNGDEFGIAVALSGDTILVGAHLAGDNGAVYAFTRSGGVWTQQAKLTASDGAAGDGFGYAVAVAGDTAVIGAYEDDDSGSNAGSAYIFSRTGSAWSQAAKLVPGDLTGGNRFGTAVSLGGDIALIGAPFQSSSTGAVYAYVGSGSSWSQQAKLTASDGAALDLFGHALALSEDTAVIGAYQDDDNGSNSGSAYIFRRVGGSWSQEAKLVGSDTAAGDEFGRSVAIAGDTAVVGAGNHDHAGLNNSGAAYLFTRSGGSWLERAKLVAADPALADQFGRDGVAVAGETAVVGSKNDDDRGTNSGSAYLFTTCTESAASGDWQNGATWVSGNAPSSASHACIRGGHTVTLAGNTAVASLTIDPTATLDLASHTLTVADGVTNNGVMQQTQTVNGTAEFLHLQDGGGNSQYRAVFMDSNGQDLGPTTVTVRELNEGEFCTSDGSDSPPYANRCYNIAPTVTEPDDPVLLRLYARTADELNGINEADLLIYHWNGVEGFWEAQMNNLDTGNVGAYSYAAADVWYFSPFLLGGDNMPTAVTLTTLTATSQTSPGALLLLTFAAFSLLLIGRKLWLAR